MRKSLPLLSTLIFTASSLGLMNTTSVSAIVETPEGETLYTLEDVREMNTDMDALIAENCGTDLMNCGRDYYDNKLYNEPQYRPLEYYLNSNILITSLTPSSGQLKLYYNNTDGMMRWYGPSTRELQALHLAWTDLSLEESSATFPFAPALSSLETVPEWYHFIYSSAPGTNDTTILPQAETTIQSITKDMSSLARGGGIQFTTEEVNGGFSSGWFFVSSCFDSPYYKEGMECRLAFTDNYRTKFIPYKNGIPAWLAPEDEEDTTNNNPTADNNTTENITNADQPTDINPIYTDEAVSRADNTRIVYVTTTSSNTSNNSSTPASTPVSYYVASTTDATTSPVTTDDTKKENDNKKSDSSSAEKNNDTRESENNFSVPLSGEGQHSCSSDFPWWFIFLVLGVDAAIMLIFWPKNRQNKIEE